MAQQGDVTVTIAVVLRNLRTAMKNLRSGITSIQGMSNQVLSDVAFNGQRIQKIFGGFEGAVKAPLFNTSQGAAALKSNLDDANKAGKQMGEDFPGYAMTLMFAGMIMQRAFHNIWKSASQTFNSVMSKVDGQTTSFERLSNSVEYLKFTMGQALEPIAAWLVPIVDAIAEWVSHNPMLARLGTILLGIAGYMFFLGGNTILTQDALKELASEIKEFLPSLKSMGKSVVDIGKKIGTWLIAKIKAAGAALASAPIGALAAWAATLAAIIALTEVIATQHGITWWEAFQEFLKNMWNGFIDIFNWLGQAAIVVTEKMRKPFDWLIDKIAEGFEWLINEKILPFINKAIEAYNTVNGMAEDVSTIGKIDVEYDEMMDKAYDDAQLGLNEALEAIKFDALQSKDAEMSFTDALKKSISDNTSKFMSILGLSKKQESGQTGNQDRQTQSTQPNVQNQTINVEVNDNIDMREFKRQYLSGR